MIALICDLILLLAFPNGSNDPFSNHDHHHHHYLDDQLDNEPSNQPFHPTANYQFQSAIGFYLPKNNFVDRNFFRTRIRGIILF